MQSRNAEKSVINGKELTTKMLGIYCSFDKDDKDGMVCNNTKMPIILDHTAYYQSYNEEVVYNSIEHHAIMIMIQNPSMEIIFPDIRSAERIEKSMSGLISLCNTDYDNYIFKTEEVQHLYGRCSSSFNRLNPFTLRNAKRIGTLAEPPYYESDDTDDDDYCVLSARRRGDKAYFFSLGQKRKYNEAPPKRVRFSGRNVSRNDRNGSESPRYEPESPEPERPQFGKKVEAKRVPAGLNEGDTVVSPIGLFGKAMGLTVTKEGVQQEKLPSGTFDDEPSTPLNDENNVIDESEDENYDPEDLEHCLGKMPGLAGVGNGED